MRSKQIINLEKTIQRLSSELVAQRQMFAWLEDKVNTIEIELNMRKENKKHG